MCSLIHRRSSWPFLRSHPVPILGDINSNFATAMYLLADLGDGYVKIGGRLRSFSTQFHNFDKRAKQIITTGCLDITISYARIIPASSKIHLNRRNNTFSRRLFKNRIWTKIEWVVAPSSWLYEALCKIKKGPLGTTFSQKKLKKLVMWRSEMNA